MEEIEKATRKVLCIKRMLEDGEISILYKDDLSETLESILDVFTSLQKTMDKDPPNHSEMEEDIRTPNCFSENKKGESHENGSRPVLNDGEHATDSSDSQNDTTENVKSLLLSSAYQCNDSECASSVSLYDFFGRIVHADEQNPADMSHTLDTMNSPLLKETTIPENRLYMNLKKNDHYNYNNDNKNNNNNNNDNPTHNETDIVNTNSLCTLHETTHFRSKEDSEERVSYGGGSETDIFLGLDGKKLPMVQDPLETGRLGQDKVQTPAATNDFITDGVGVCGVDGTSLQQYLAQVNKDNDINRKHESKNLGEINGDESAGTANIVTEQLNKLKRQRMYGCVRNIVKSVSKKSRENILDSVYDRPYDPVDETEHASKSSISFAVPDPKVGNKRHNWNQKRENSFRTPLQSHYNSKLLHKERQGDQEQRYGHRHSRNSFARPFLHSSSARDYSPSIPTQSPSKSSSSYPRSEYGENQYRHEYGSRPRHSSSSYSYSGSSRR